MLNVIRVVVSKMTSDCAGTVQMREESESGIRKWEEMWFKTTAEDRGRGGSSDMWWKTVPQTSGYKRKLSPCVPGPQISCRNFGLLLPELGYEVLNRKTLKRSVTVSGQTSTANVLRRWWGSVQWGPPGPLMHAWIRRWYQGTDRLHSWRIPIEFLVLNNSTTMLWIERIADCRHADKTLATRDASLPRRLQQLRGSRPESLPGWHVSIPVLIVHDSLVHGIKNSHDYCDLKSPVVTITMITALLVVVAVVVLSASICTEYSAFRLTIASTFCQLLECKIGSP